MIRNFIYSIGLLFVVFVAFSCNKEEQDKANSKGFVKFFGNGINEISTDLVSYKNGFAITGYMQTPDSATQACLVVTDENGDEKPWSPVLMGGINNDVGNKIVVLSNGDLLVIGTTEIDPTGVDSCNIFAVRISENGIIKWKKNFGGSACDEGLFGIETTFNEIFIGGYTQSFGNGARDICIYKIDSNGQSIWTSPSTIGLPGNETGCDIVESNGKLFIVGSTQSYNSENLNYGYIVQVSMDNGLPEDVKYLATGTNDLKFTKIFNLFPSQNSLFIIGQAQLAGSGTKNIYIAKISPHDISNILWAKSISSDYNEIPCDIVLKNNNISVVGTRQLTNSTSFVIYNFDTNGNALFTNVLPNSGSVLLTSSLILSNDNYCFLGFNSFNNYSHIMLIKGISF